MLESFGSYTDSSAIAVVFDPYTFIEILRYNIYLFVVDKQIVDALLKDVSMTKTII